MMIKLFGELVCFDDELLQEICFLQLFNCCYFLFVLFVVVIWICQVILMFVIYIFGLQIVGLFGWEQGCNVVFGNVVISFFFMLGCILVMFWLNSIGCCFLFIGSFVMMIIVLVLLGLVLNLGIILVVVVFVVYVFFFGGLGIL